MPGSASAPTVLTLSDEDAGLRLDRVLARRCPEFSRSALQRWIEQGRVEQAGEVVSRKTKALAGAEVSILPAPPEAMSAEPQDIPLAIVFEDAHRSSSTSRRGSWFIPRPATQTARSSTLCSTMPGYRAEPTPCVRASCIDSTRTPAA